VDYKSPGAYWETSTQLTKYTKEESKSKIGLPDCETK